jgi:hypothetical protein
MKGKNIDFGWESREERIRRGMLISPRNKLIWLKEINELRCLCVPARIRKALARYGAGGDKKT